MEIYGFCVKIIHKKFAYYQQEDTERYISSWIGDKTKQMSKLGIWVLVCVSVCVSTSQLKVFWFISGVVY
jgi:hypothetical protein